MSAKIVLNEGEQKLLASAWFCMKDTPKIDYSKLASIMGHTNPQSTNNALKRVLKKIELGSDADADTPAATPKSKSKAKDSSKGKSNDNPKDNLKGRISAAGKGTKRKAEDFEKGDPYSRDDTEEYYHRYEESALGSKGKKKAAFGAPESPVEMDNVKVEDSPNGLSAQFAPVNSFQMDSYPMIENGTEARSAGTRSRSKSAEKRAGGKNAKATKGARGGKGKKASEGQGMSDIAEEDINGDIV